MTLPPHDGKFKELYYTVIGKVVGRELTSLALLTDDEWQRAATWIRKVQSGENSMPKRFSDYFAAIDKSQVQEDEEEPDMFADVPVEAVPA